MSATLLLFLACAALALTLIFLGMAGYAAYRENLFKKHGVVKNATVQTFPVVSFIRVGQVLSCKLDKPWIYTSPPGTLLTVLIVKTPFGLRARPHSDSAWYRHLGKEEVCEYILFAVIFFLLSMLCFAVSYLMCATGDLGFAAKVFKDMMEVLP